MGKFQKILEQKIKENIEYKSLGLIENDRLYEIYNNSDCFLFPSKIETLVKLSLKLFCGTPVVAFNQFAPKDIITHKVNGYLVKPYDMNDLLAGIEYASNQIKFDEKNNEILKKNYGYIKITKSYPGCLFRYIKKITTRLSFPLVFYFFSKFLFKSTLSLSVHTLPKSFMLI